MGSTSPGIVGIVFALDAGMSRAHAECKVETRLTRCTSAKRVKRSIEARTKPSLTVSTSGITPPNSSLKSETAIAMGAPPNVIATDLTIVRLTNIPMPIGNCPNKYINSADLRPHIVHDVTFHVAEGLIDY